MERYSGILVSKLALWTGPDRDPEREKEILEDEYAYGAVMYAADVLKKRWPEAEPFIAKESQVAYMYARDVIGGRWPEAEETLAEEAYWANNYAKDVLNGRFPLGEPAIMEHPGIAYEYAKDVLRGRWPEAEPHIKTDTYFWDQYKIFLRLIGQRMDLWEHAEWE